MRKSRKHRRSPIHAYKRLLARDRDWDWCFLLALEKKKIERMRDSIAEHHTHVGWRQNVREMSICLRLIDIITQDDAVYKDWLHRNYSGKIEFRDCGNGLKELLSPDRPLEDMSVYVNTRNELRFFRATHIADARKEGREKYAKLLVPELRRLKAMHLYHLIREYKLFEWWD